MKMWRNNRAESIDNGYIHPSTRICEVALLCCCRRNRDTSGHSFRGAASIGDALLEQISVMIHLCPMLVLRWLSLQRIELLQVPSNQCRVLSSTAFWLLSGGLQEGFNFFACKHCHKHQNYR